MFPLVLLLTHLLVPWGADAQTSSEKTRAPRTPSGDTSRRPQSDAPPAAAPNTATPNSATAPKPGVHAPTGLNFPVEMAGTIMTRTVDYSQPPTNEARLGISHHYRGSAPIDLSFYLYTGGIRVPDDVADPIIQAQFEQADREIAATAAKTGRYRDMRVVAGPTVCRLGAIQFRCMTYAALMADAKPVFTSLLVGGSRGYFVKIRLDWPRDQNMNAAGEGVLNAFVAAQKSQ